MATSVVNISESIQREQQIAATTSATTGLAILFAKNVDGSLPPTVTVLLTASGADITFKFGGSTVAASTTVDGTTFALPDGNFTITSGKTYSVRLSPTTQAYVSVKTATGSGTVYINTTGQLS